MQIKKFIAAILVIAGGYLIYDNEKKNGTIASWWAKLRGKTTDPDPNTQDASTPSSTPPESTEATDPNRLSLTGNDGTTLNGYPLPENQSDVKFPILLGVRPDMKLSIGLVAGDGFNVEKLSDGTLAYIGKINGIKKNWNISYQELKEKTLIIHQN